MKDVRGGQSPRPGAVSEEEPAALRPAGRAREDAAPPATRDARALREDPAGRRRERERPRGRPTPSPREACAGEPLSPPGSAGGPAGSCQASSGGAGDRRDSCKFIRLETPEPLVVPRYGNSHHSPSSQLFRFLSWFLVEAGGLPEFPLGRACCMVCAT